MLLSSLYANDIDSLLSDYAQESELSNKTKNESAGHLIVYTRDDLERMQVESLKDILKSLRLFAYTENRMGQPDILNQDPINYYSSSVRVYLNETELITGISGSGLLLFGDMEIDFIDHVEIYQGFPSFDFGIEPATTVIRLYSKSAKHDEGGRVKATLSTNGANKQNVYYTNKENGISYFIYANHTDNIKDTYQYDGETLKRDTETNRFYGSLETENHSLEFHVMNSKGDAFLGFIPFVTPNSTYQEHTFINIATNSKFMNDSLLLNFSYVKTDEQYLFKYDSPTPLTPFTSYNKYIDENVFTTSLKKIFTMDNHDITVGGQFRYKNFDMSKRYLDGSLSNPNQNYDAENIYSIFSQDTISINDNSLISLSIMDQEFDRNNNMNNQNTLQLRFGYIYTNNEWISKTFISSQEFATEPYMLMKNKNLEATTYKSVLQEVSYQTPQTFSKIILGFGTSDKMIVLDGSAHIVNSEKEVPLYTAIAEFTYHFSEKDKLELQVNYWFIESPLDTVNDNIEHISYVARMLNSTSDFDIFNELILHTGYAGVNDGFDYTAGIKYHINKDFYVNIKGENIFDTALETDYYHIDFAPPSTFSKDKITIPTIERRFTLGVEYLF